MTTRTSRQSRLVPTGNTIENAEEQRNKSKAGEETYYNKADPSWVIEPGSVILTPEAAQTFKDLVESVMKMQAGVQDLCKEFRAELTALRALLITRGVITEKEWNRCRETTREVIAGVSDEEITKDILQEILRKFDGRKQ